MTTPNRAALACVLLVAATFLSGAFIRFYNLGLKYYYDDEAVSSLREAGHTAAEFRRAFDGRVRTAAQLSSYLANEGTTPARTVHSLAAEDPQHPPLYYLLDQLWARAAGQTVSGWRGLAALFGSLAVLGAFWLGWELFGSFLGAWILAALVAFSPLAVVYSQWNREYSFWLLILTVSGALLQRALRRRTAMSWIAYSVAAALGLYVAVLFLLNLISFGLYVAFRERRWTPSAGGFFVATAASCAAYAPWFFVLARGSHTVVAWNGPALLPLSAKIYALKWLFYFGATFFDMEYQHASLLFLIVPVLALLLVASLYTAVSAPREVWSFILALAIVPAGAFVGYDLVHHSSHGSMSRYLIPLWFSGELAVAYFVWSLAASTRRASARWVGAGILACVLALGLASDVSAFGATTTWAASHTDILGLSRSRIDPAPDALVVYVHDGIHWDLSVLALQTVLPPRTRVQLFPALSVIRPAGERFFLFNATDETERVLQRRLGGRWQRIDAPAVRSRVVAQLQAEAASDRAHRGPGVARGQGSPLWERRPDASAADAKR